MAPTSPCFASSARVVLGGLNARPELNGQPGKVLGFDEAKGRYAVLIDSSKEKILLKPANLTAEPSPTADGIDYDALLEGPDFAVLRTTLLQASSRPGARSYAQSLKGALPFGKPPLKAIVSLLTDEEEEDGPHPAQLVQQACDALARMCTMGPAARHAVLAAGAAPALVVASRGYHSVQQIAERAAAAGPTTAPAAGADEEPRIVDVTDDLSAASLAGKSLDQGRGDCGKEAASAVACDSAEPRSASPIEEAAERAANEAACASDDAAAGAAGRQPPTDPLLVTRACCHALCNLANGDLSCKQAVVRAGGTGAITDALDRGKADAYLTKIGIGGIANIAAGDSECVRDALKHRGVRAVAERIHAYMRLMPEMLGDAALALANFASTRDGPGPAAVCDDGGLAALVAAAQHHGEASPKLREWTAACMSNLASSAMADVHDALLEVGVPKVALTLLGCCDLGDESGCRCAKFCVGVFVHLARDANEDDERREACVRAGWVEATCKVLSTTPRDAKGGAILLEECCRACAALAFADADGRGRLREAGARKALTCALDTYPREPRVQEMGRALLAEIGN